MKQERKSYFAATVEAAISQARIELGDDTLLVESRRMPASLIRPEGYEVIFEYSSPEVEAEAGLPYDEESLFHEVGKLRHDLSLMADMLNQLVSTTLRSRSDLAPLAAQLAAADMPQSMVCGLIQMAQRRLGLAATGHTPPRLIHRALTAELESRLKVLSEPGDAVGPRVIALVGPPGAGKTTTIAKLAVQLGLTQSASTLAVSTDLYRVAAADQLRAYSAILGIPFAIAESPAALGKLLTEHRDKEVILIDTPGFGPAEWELAADWAVALLAQQSIEIHLVLSACSRYRDMKRWLQSWQQFNPTSLICTHLDETESIGGLITIAIESGLPLSYTTTGQQVPEDIERASIASVLTKLLGKPQASRSAAA